MKIPNMRFAGVAYALSLARIVSEDSQPRMLCSTRTTKSSKDS